MATLTKVSPSLSTQTPDHSCQVGSGLLAGEDLTAGDICYIKSDGKVWKSNGTSANAAAKADGIVPRDYKAGQGCTLFVNVEFQYAAGMTPGARYYVSATAGRLDDAATTGGTAAVAKAVSADRIRFFGSNY